MTGFVYRLRHSIMYHTMQRVSPCRVRSNLTRPIASFTFDDAPASAFETGARILEERSVAGTFYVVGAFCGGLERGLPHFKVQHMRDALARGHEIGCHTFDHVNLFEAPGDALDKSCEKNAEFLRETIGELRPVSFAYPFGEINFRAKAAAARRFITSRGVNWGVNVGAMDFAQLKANSLDRCYAGQTEIAAQIETAKREAGWILFFTHGVNNEPALEGCKPDDLARTVDAVLEAGIRILPVKNAANRVRYG